MVSLAQGPPRFSLLPTPPAASPGGAGPSEDPAFTVKMSPKGVTIVAGPAQHGIFASILRGKSTPLRLKGKKHSQLEEFLKIVGIRQRSRITGIPVTPSNTIDTRLQMRGS